MKKITLYRVFNPENDLTGMWNWSVTPIENAWNRVENEGFEVEVPDSVEICETVYGTKEIFMDDIHQELTIGDSFDRDSAPYLVDGRHEPIKLNVLG